MELLYIEEHLRCINYDRGDHPIMELISVEKDRSWSNLPLGNKLIFLLNGEILFSFGKFTDCLIQSKQILYLPAGNNFICNAIKNSTLLIVCIQGYTSFCDDFLFKDLEKSLSDIPESQNPIKLEPATLEINRIMEKYLDALLEFINIGAKCRHFYIIKIKELFYIFRWFYPKETLMEFFRYALKGGNEFAAYIMDTWSQYKSVTELAEAMNYSVSGFEKRFRRVFGVSPYKWITTQKAERIFHQVRTTNSAFKQISAEFGFTSLSRFNDFCKSNFGKSPGEIRENNEIGGNHEKMGDY